LIVHCVQLYFAVSSKSTEATQQATCVGPSRASAVSEGVDNGDEGMAQQQPVSVPNQGNSQLQPPKQHSVPGSRGVMWPHLVASSSNPHKVPSPEQRLVSSQDLTFLQTPTSCRPTRGSHNTFIAAAANSPAYQPISTDSGYPSMGGIQHCATCGFAHPMPAQGTSPRFRTHSAPTCSHRSATTSPPRVFQATVASQRAPSPCPSNQMSHQTLPLTRWRLVADTYRPPTMQYCANHLHAAPEHNCSYHLHAGPPVEIQRVATTHLGHCESCCNTYNSSAMDNTGSYGSGSMNLNTRSMRWVAMSDALASGKLRGSKPSFNHVVRQATASASRGQKPHAQQLQPGSVNSVATAQQHGSPDGIVATAQQHGSPDGVVATAQQHGSPDGVVATAQEHGSPDGVPSLQATTDPCKVSVIGSKRMASGTAKDDKGAFSFFRFVHVKASFLRRLCTSTFKRCSSCDAQQRLHIQM
jgi:hypothetical protein